MAAGTHLAALCSEPGQRNRLKLAFRQEGLWQGDGYLWLTDSVEPARASHARTSMWTTLGHSHFDVRLASDVFLFAGRLSVDRMTAILAEGVAHAGERGCPRLRVMVDMGWLQRQPLSVNDVVLYEKAVDDVVSQLPAVVMCMYDLHDVVADMLAPVLSAHQAVFADGASLVNPRYRAGTGHGTFTGPDWAHRSSRGERDRRTQQNADDRWDELTESELRIVAHVVAGQSNREMAEALVISRHTVDAHLKHIYVKLDIHTRVELTVLALEREDWPTARPGATDPLT